jgi:broad specificity phosphatase PhoE
MKLILARHGETIENRYHITQGQNQGELSRKGKEQAKKLGEKLKEENIDIIYCSDLRRAHKTAKEVSKYHDKPLIPTQGLRELDKGPFNGKKNLTLYWREVEHLLENPWKAEKRVKEFFEETLEKHFGKTVVFVTHGAFLRVLIRVIEDKKIDNSIFEDEKMKNCSISIYEFDKDKKPKLITFNDVRHL